MIQKDPLYNRQESYIHSRDEQKLPRSAPEHIIGAEMDAQMKAEDSQRRREILNNRVVVKRSGNRVEINDPERSKKFSGNQIINLELGTEDVLVNPQTGEYTYLYTVTRTFKTTFKAPDQHGLASNFQFALTGIRLNDILDGQVHYDNQAATMDTSEEQINNGLYLVALLESYPFPNRGIYAGGLSKLPNGSLIFNSEEQNNGIWNGILAMNTRNNNNHSPSRIIEQDRGY